MGETGEIFTWGGRHLLAWLRRSCTVVVEFEFFNLVPIVRALFYVLRLTAKLKSVLTKNTIVSGASPMQNTIAIAIFLMIN